MCSAYTAASNSRCVSHGETAFPAAGWYIAVELIESAGTRSGSGEASQKLLEGMVLLQAPQLRIQSSFAFPLIHGVLFEVAALELSGPQNFFQLANALDSNQGSQMMLMMRGMTAKNFDPVRYSGRWFEVASLKRGFAGQGQEDCHCTQGVYSFDAETLSIQVDTFCVHGGPDGYITGIRGKVQCLSLENMEKAETDLEMTEMIKEKCFLRFPTLPFIPKEPYDVIATDYDNFALVSGAKDRSFVQIYSRRPDPGADFINKYKLYLADLGYDPNKIKDTPQDCQVMSSAQLALMMSRTGMKEALTNQFPDLGLTGLAINPFTSIFDTLRKLLQLYFNDAF
ncbi:hypothetical protein MA16_Dca001538 [Dendrobium catenatum]|uniref:Lipocalin/cytosolic fatty-acid binding domain-containing protein n=1 Tax=Dendrobium catenatum TaxID=906689 RepID=A0A2I0WMN7_9ASPA|nr:hypothetical protein MA16_Dca001538 [Dendrobium catenatum]